ncbi:MAG: GTP cyclohydrolase I, partial [Flavobacteriaceae bacterium]
MKMKSTLEEHFEGMENEHVSSGEDTPLRDDAFVLTDDEKIERIRGNIREVMLTLGLDLDDDSLKGTPTRVAKMFVKEIFGGLHPDRKPKSST